MSLLDQELHPLGAISVDSKTTLSARIDLHNDDDLSVPA